MVVQSAQVRRISWVCTTRPGPERIEWPPRTNPFRPGHLH